VGRRCRTHVINVNKMYRRRKTNGFKRRQRIRLQTHKYRITTIIILLSIYYIIHVENDFSSEILNNKYALYSIIIQKLPGNLRLIIG